MNSTREERERSELGRLIRFARRFAPSFYKERPPVRNDNLFELWWLHAPLEKAIATVLPDNYALLQKARAASGDSTLSLGLWQEVARLPCEVVQEMIDYVHWQRGIWDLEEYLEASHEEDQ